MRAATLALLLAAVLSSPARAQVRASGPVVSGHHHVNVSDVAAHRRFWIEALGGTPVKLDLGATETVRFPRRAGLSDAEDTCRRQQSTTVNHVGFETPDVRKAVDRVKAAGFPMVTREELPASYEVKDDLGQRPGGTVVAFVMGPDGSKVELMHSPAITEPILLHHVHFAVPDGKAAQAWYTNVLGGTMGSRIGQPAVDLPGVNLTFGPAPEAVSGTRGRAIDHIGFEVSNLEQFARDLEARGVKLDRPYTTLPAVGVATVFLTDPWGTFIELTEGLRNIGR